MNSRYEHLVVSAHDGALNVQIDRPEKHNALSRAVLTQLRDVFTTHAANHTLRVAILRGAGDKSFAAGGDLRDLSAVRTAAEASQMAADGRAALEAVRNFPVPVIAALNGDAVGGGAELAVACDFRVAANHAKIGFIQGRLNISTGWGGGADLMGLLGPARALRVLCRSEVMNGPEALAAGMIDAVATLDQDLDSAVAQFIAPILKQAPQVVRAFKALAYGVRRKLPQFELEALETSHFAATWVHDEHWAAAEKILKPRREA